MAKQFVKVPHIQRIGSRHSAVARGAALLRAHAVQERSGRDSFTTLYSNQIAYAASEAAPQGSALLEPPPCSRTRTS
eukprot:3686579-Pleurochrysis_carterae.AAC.8